jgi:peptidoglycan/xylan/chitin deacetylase (PgdA/CDA1 family)
MYHRVAEPTTDVWGIAVASRHFEQQVRVLQQTRRVIPLRELADGLIRQSLPSNALSLTFDDGYADNYTVVRPVLEYYGLPATFFVASGHIGQAREFWWDELENLMLGTPVLPPVYSGVLRGKRMHLPLQGEQRLNSALRQNHQRWNAQYQAAPTQRARLFLQLYQHLQPMLPGQQQAMLAELRAWAGVEAAPRASYQCMTADQLRQLGQNPLFDLGGHTVSHLSLASHSLALQQGELEENRRFLERTAGKPVPLVAYPYGHCNEDTRRASARAGYRAGFTTAGVTLSSSADVFSLGRFQVPNVPGNTFLDHLRSWQQSKAHAPPR